MKGLAQFARRAPVTSLLLLACASMFALMCARGSFETGGPAFDEATLRRFGALDPERVWQGQTWRLLMAGLIHGDPLHLLFNSWALVALGPAVERVLSPPRAVLLVLGSQLGCATTHLCFGTMSPLIGASGIACGMLGGLLVTLLRRRDPLAMAGRRTLAFWALQVLVFSIAIPGVSLLGHLGGGLAGAALMVGLEPSLEGQRAERAVSMFFACVLLAVAVRLALVEPERANWNLVQGFALYRHHHFDDALPYLRRGLAQGAGDFRPEVVHAALGDSLLELHDRDAGLPELDEGAEGGSSFAAERLAKDDEDPHRAIAHLARALEVAPQEAVDRPELRDEALRELVDELLVEVVELGSHGELPTAGDFAPLVHLPEAPIFSPVAAVRGLLSAQAGDLGPLQALAFPAPLDGGAIAPPNAIAARLLGAVQADGGSVELARVLRASLLETPGLFEHLDAGADDLDADDSFPIP